MLIFKTDYLKDICSKILFAVDTSDNSVLTETLEIIAENNKITINVTNREYYVSVSLPFDDDTQFKASINAELFLKLVAQTTTEDIKLTIEGNSLVFKGNGTYKMPLIYDGKELLTLPKITLNNIVSTFTVSSDNLNSILTYNSKEMNKGTIVKPVQRYYYVDNKGAITFTSGACVNSFDIDTTSNMLLNGKLVKLFKLFKDEDVSCALSKDTWENNDDIIQTKVSFSTPSITITSILSCDDSMINSVPVKAIRSRADDIYPYSVTVNRDKLLQAVNRILLADTIGATNLVKPYTSMEFDEKGVTLFNYNKENSEYIVFENDNNGVTDGYTMSLNLNDLKITLETCSEPYFNMNFGNKSAVVISRGNIKNILSEIRAI